MIKNREGSNAKGIVAQEATFANTLTRWRSHSKVGPVRLPY